MPFDTLAADLLVMLDKHAQAGRFSPIFFIRESNVVGFTPRSSAAPSAPLIFQLALSRTAARFSRSRCSISGSVRNSAPTLSPVSPGCELMKAEGVRNLSPPAQSPAGRHALESERSE